MVRPRFLFGVAGCGCIGHSAECGHAMACRPYTLTVTIRGYPRFVAKDVDVLGDVSVGDPYIRQGSHKL